MRTESNESGLTLLELLLVLVFISIGVLALSVVQSHSLTDVHATGRHTRALDLAQLQLERARAAGYALVVADSGASAPFTWVNNVDQVDAALRRVTTTVSWTESGVTRSVELACMVSSR